MCLAVFLCLFIDVFGAFLAVATAMLLYSANINIRLCDYLPKIYAVIVQVSESAFFDSDTCTITYHVMVCEKKG